MRTPKPKHSFNRTNQAACRFLKQTQKAIIRLNSLGLGCTFYSGCFFSHYFAP